MKKPKSVDVRKFNKLDFLRIVFIVLSAFFVNNLVYYTGGTSGAWAQLNIFIIVIAAYYWGIKGSALIALVLGIITGPMMPLDTVHGVMQSTYNWVFRLLLHIFIAFLIGYILTKNKELNEDIKERDLVTGLYNTNKLFNDLDEKIKEKESFILIFINIVNLEEISKYVSYGIVDKIMYSGINELSEVFEDCCIYSSSYNEYILALKDYNEEKAVENTNQYFSNLNKSMQIKDYSFRLVTKAGIANYNGEDKGKNVYNKARIAADQGSKYESGV